MNKVMLIGNVGKEPDVRYYDADQARRFPIVPNGIPLCSIALLPR